MISDKQKRNMLSRREGSLLLIRQNTEDASDDEWSEFLGFLTENRAKLHGIRILILTDGGTATASQRKRLAETLGETHMQVAVVSDSIKVRFAGSTISLFQRDYRQFAVKEMSKAHDHLQLNQSERRQAETIFADLSTRLAR
jgi:hypothetical protein